MCYTNTVKDWKHSVHSEMHIAHNQKQTLNEPSGLLEDCDRINTSRADEETKWEACSGLW